MNNIKTPLLATYGINSDGEGLSKLLDALSDSHAVKLYHHPKRHFYHGWLYRTLLKDAEGLKRLSFRHESSPDVVGHSYGALVVLMSLWLGAKYRNVYLFGAAASSDRVPLHLYAQNAQFEKLMNFHNVKDRALKAGALLPCHPFGHLGYSGWRGPDHPNITNVDFFMTEGLLRHSGYFNAENIKRIVAKIDKHFT